MNNSKYINFIMYSKYFMKYVKIYILIIKIIIIIIIISSATDFWGKGLPIECWPHVHMSAETSGESRRSLSSITYHHWVTPKYLKTIISSIIPSLTFNLKHSGSFPPDIFPSKIISMHYDYYYYCNSSSININNINHLNNQRGKYYMNILSI